ncbi:triacylglycerol lipase, partial [Streptococcus pluranimalium]
MAVTDKNYNDIADGVYKVDSGKVKRPWRKGKTFKTNKQSFRVLKVKDNTDNGMQAMAVAPVDKNGEADYSKVVIAYAGTNSKNVADLVTDGKMIGLGDTEAYGFHPNRMMIPAQSATALDFAKQVEKEV